MKPEVKDYLLNKVTEELMMTSEELERYKKLVDIKDDTFANTVKERDMLKGKVETLEQRVKELEDKLLLSQTMNGIEKEINKPKVGRPKKY